jgi:hypothetical protein
LTKLTKFFFYFPPLFFQNKFPAPIIVKCRCSVSAIYGKSNRLCLLCLSQTRRKGDVPPRLSSPAVQNAEHGVGVYRWAGENPCIESPPFRQHCVSAMRHGEAGATAYPNFVSRSYRHSICCLQTRLHSCIRSVESPLFRGTKYA